ncbi:peroxisomal biogenesis factor 19 [Zerene cesonia]|uniref:peroxisomal biogenesis factor 19 n=1 Tax=Zerene cesonia TaxID=33412 RepID=UPI0018E58A21|nr:peroxisomal biogenesis factor 19 [Zerene cesonia]
MSDNNKEVEKKDVDPELDDLLDSALQDMTKKPPEQPAVADGQNMWSEEFIKEAAAQFESNMAAILGSFSGMPEEQISQEQIAQTFSKMAEAAAQVLKPQAEGSEVQAAEADPNVQDKIDEVSAAISQTLQNLNTNTESLQTPFSDADLASMFSNFNLGEAGQAEGNMFVPFMQGMMQSLLSKEVLYPSLKELVDKYPAWLDANRGKIEAKELERFEKQQELMQRMQDLGQPPTELVGDIAAPPEGFAPAPGQDPSQCCLM